MQLTMRGIVINAGCAPEIRNVPTTAQGIDAFLGGRLGNYSQMVPFSTKPAALIYVPQKPGMEALPTRRYAGRWYYGRLLIVGFRGCRMQPLTEALARDLAEHFMPVEVSRL